MSETRIRGRLALGALSAGVFLSSLGCSSGEEEKEGSLRGRFVENVARFDDGHMEVSYTLFRGTGRSDRHDLVFDKAPDLVSNTEIKVWGTEVAGRIKVDRFEV